MRATQRLCLSVLVVFLAGLSTFAHAQAALQFVPLPTPCRAFDTRNSGGPIAGGMSQAFSIPQSTCNIPSTAAAYSLNVTLVPFSGPVYVVTVWPTGQTQPSSSLMNSYDSRVKANAAIVPAGTPNQEISVYVSNAANIVLDVDGYFVPATDSAYAFYPLTPCRIADTRGGQYLHANTPSTFAITGSSCDVPATATAYSLNFTVLPRNDDVWVFTAWPAGLPMPGTSTLNDPTGTAVANAAIVPAPATGGDIEAQASADTDLVIDINGYFGPPTQTPPGQALYAATSTCRVLNWPDLFSGELTVDVLGSQCQPSPNATAYVLNATVVPQGSLGFLTLWPDTENQPNASTLNAWDGAVTSNMAIVPTINGKIDAYAPSSTNLILDMASYFAPLGTLTVTTTSLADGATGEPYNQTLMASGGEPPYSWTVTNGTLPPGLTLSANGVIQGTPTASGSYPFTVRVTDAFSNTADANLNINITVGSLVITTTSLPQGTVNVAYDATLGAAGGVPPYSWSLAQGSGSLPAGLTLATSGLISGTPTTAGSSNFTVQVTDQELNTTTAPLQIVINAATTNQALNGPYAFSFNGFNSGKPLVMAGHFVADGAGNITGGVLDLNNGSGSPTLGTAFSGTYTITANGLGTMTFNAGSLGMMNFHIDASNQGNGTFVQDNADPDTRGSGTFYVQNMLDFALPPNGAYALGSFGADNNLNRYARAGALQMTLGAVSNSEEDDNDNGTVTNRTFTGRFQPPNLSTGRGQVSFTFPNGVLNTYSYYVVYTGQIVMMGIDPLSAQDPLTLGTVTQQSSGGFTNASLTGISAIEVNGVAPNGGSPVADVALGLVTADGNGNVTVSLDENQGGTLTQQQVSQGTYSVAANGRVTFTGLGANAPILYLSSSDQAFVLGTGASASSGILEQQTATPPFGNPSIEGTYLGGTETPVLAAVVDTVNWLFADGNGNVNGIQDYSGPSGTGTQNLSLMYQVDSTGRAVVTGTVPGIAYVVTSKRLVMLPNGNTPALNVFTTANTQGQR